MNFIGPTSAPRLNEAVGVVLLFAVVILSLCLVSYHPQDPSWNTASAGHARNLIGRFGSHVADVFLQTLGLGSFLLPAFLAVLSWKWIRSTGISLQLARLAGIAILQLCVCAMLALIPEWRTFDQSIPSGGLAGSLLADLLVGWFNVPGAVLCASAGVLLSLYLVSSFSMFRLPAWFSFHARMWTALRGHWTDWREHRRRTKDRPVRRARASAPEAPPGTPVEMTAVCRVHVTAARGLRSR
jgi:S-DNA-T family DNA segregation ATPase FtsK/SpoIIIE